MMNIQIIEDAATALADYSAISIAFEVTEVFDVGLEPNRDGEFALSARRLAAPYVKDYDAVENPSQWARRFDVSKWSFLSAFNDGVRIGGAVIAFDTPAVHMLERRRDLAVLWDIRVAPSWRRRAVGSALFDAAVTWASQKGCRALEIETQNINVAACRFYEQRGCVLRAVRPGAYPAFPDEIQLLWFKNLVKWSKSEV